MATTVHDGPLLEAGISGTLVINEQADGLTLALQKGVFVNQNMSKDSTLLT